MFKDMLEFIKTAWPARGFVVPCLIGPPGIGKTAAVKQAAEELMDDGATGKVVTIIASQILPNEVSGITMPVPEERAMEIFDHYRLSSLRDGDILFFDELLEADQMVLSACLTLIESRQLMSGNELPDIMIVAATNPTINSGLLKLNIRQRFMWRNFGLDRGDCHDFILRTYGLDLDSKIMDCVTDEGSQYNVMTQRSLSKCVAWICESKDKSQAKDIAKQINKIWGNQIGTELYKAWQYSLGVVKPSDQVRLAIRSSIESHYSWRNPGLDDPIGKIIHDDEFLNESSITSLMEILQDLPEWETIARELGSISLDKIDEEVDGLAEEG